MLAAFNLRNLTAHKAFIGHIFWIIAFVWISNADSILTVQSQFSNGQIAFASNYDGDYEIYIMDTDGSNIQQLTYNETDDLWPEWSPDGLKLAFTSMESGYTQIYVMDADGSNIVNVTQNETGYSPVWSPDGNKIAFTSDRNTAVDDIYLMNADGSNVVNLTQSSNSLDQLPAWSPDGNQIIFRSTRDWEPLGSSDPYYDYYIMNADGTNQSKLMSAGYEPSSVDSSSNVLKLVYALDLDVSRINISDLDGSNPSIIGSNNIIGFDPHWSPDGTQILFSARTSNSKEIAVMEADGSNFAYLTSLGVSSIQPKWQPLVVNPPASCNIIVPNSDTVSLINNIVTMNGSGSTQILCLEGTYELTTSNNSSSDGANGLPVITGNITLAGINGGATITRNSTEQFRIAKVNSGGRLVLDGITISNGDPGNQNGGGIRNLGTLEVINSVINGNRADCGGGVRNNDNATLIVTDSTISNNLSTGNGGGIYSNTGSNTTLTNVTLSGNETNVSNGLGGGLYLNNADLSMTGGTFSANNARNGGGLFVNAAPNPVTLSGVTFANNGANRQGGGLYTNTGTLTLDDVTFDSNIALRYGGAIRNGSTLTLSNSDLIANTGRDNGGGGIANFGTLSVIDSTLDGNIVDTTVGLGGGIFSQGQLTVSGGSIRNHTVWNGGGVFVDSSPADLSDVTIEMNTANNSGGGIFGTDSATLTLSGLIIQNNTANDLGGGVASDGQFTITGSRIEMNTANNTGGGLYTDSTGTGNAVNASCITGNSAPTVSGVQNDGAALSATGNWWGSADGPSGAGSGTGDAVSQNVDFTNFITTNCDDALMSMTAQTQSFSQEGSSTRITRPTPYTGTFDTGDGWQSQGSWSLERRWGVDDSPAWSADMTIRDTESILSTPFAFTLGRSRNIALSFQQTGQLEPDDRILIEIRPEGQSDWILLDEQMGLMTQDWSSRQISLADYRG